MALVAILVLVAIFAKLGWKSITVGEWLQISLLTALVFVTMYYAQATARQARASVEMAEASLRPVIVLGRYRGMIRNIGLSPMVESQEKITGFTTAYNAGNGPAVNIRFLLMGPSRLQAEVTEEHPGLTGLGPGEIFTLSLGQAYERMGWVSHDLCAEYEDVARRRWRSWLALERIEGEKSFVVKGLFCESITLREGPMEKLRKWFRGCPP